MLSPKSPAPAFSMPSTSGRTVSTKDLRGKRFVLYFYPKDDTPGCTTEACDFRDNLARLNTSKVLIFGVSKDSIASHEKFRAKYGLTFELLSDAENTVAKAYGAFGEKTLSGKPVTGVIRSTFLIDADGKVERIWSPVKVEGHVDAVLAAITGGGDASVKPASRTAAPKAAKATTAAKSSATIVPPRASTAKKPAATQLAAPKSFRLARRPRRSPRPRSSRRRNRSSRSPLLLRSCLRRSRRLR